MKARFLSAALGLATVAAGACRGGLAGQTFDGPTPGPGGYALEFDGVDDYASMGTASFPDSSSPLSITFWMRYGSAAKQQTVITWRRDAVTGLQLGFRDGTLAFWRSPTGAVLASAAAPPSADVWHHIGYTFVPAPNSTVDAAMHTLYVDGAVVGTGVVWAQNQTPTAAWMGSFDGATELYAGRLDEVRIWKTARSAAEVATEAAGQPAPATDGDLLASWNFDETGAAVAKDSSGNGNHATLGDGVAARMPSRVASDIPVARQP